MIGIEVIIGGNRNEIFFSSEEENLETRADLVINVTKNRGLLQIESQIINHLVGLNFLVDDDSDRCIKVSSEKASGMQIAVHQKHGIRLAIEAAAAVLIALEDALICEEGRVYVVRTGSPINIELSEPNEVNSYAKNYIRILSNSTVIHS